jgi:hypothetical protein
MRATLVVLITLSTLGFAPVEAQTKEKLKFFGNLGEVSKNACKNALASRNYLLYYPRDRSKVGNKPAVGPTRRIRELEADMCVHEYTTEDWQWVVRPEGTKLREELVNGKWVVYADDECGNPADDTAYPSPFVGSVQLGVKGDSGARGLPGVPGEPGMPGAPGRDGKDGKGSSVGKVAGIAAIVAAAIVGGYALIDGGDDDENTGKAPNVTSDSATVVAKCTSTGTRSNCPPSPPSSSVSASFASFNDRPQSIPIPLLTEPLGPARVRVSINKIQVGVRIPFRLPR